MNARRVLVLGAALVLAAIATAQPKMEVVGGTTFDFGTIGRGVVVDRTLTLKNVGTDPLVLSGVDAACGCTGSILSDKTIPPGGTGTLKISFNSKNFSGPVQKTATIHSNAAGSPQTIVTFTATVTEEISIQPTHFWFRDAQVGSLTTATITVSNNGKSPLTLTGVKTQLQGLVLRLPKEPIAPGKSAQLTAEFKPEAARPVLSDGVFVTTSNTAQPQIYIQVFGNVKEFKFQ